MKIFKMLFTNSFTTFVLSTLSFSQQDVKVILTETSLNEALLTVTEARAANFGDRLHMIFSENFFLNLDGATININPSNQIELNASIVITITDPLIFNNLTVHATLKINGYIDVRSTDDGYKVIFKPQTTSNLQLTNGAWQFFNALFSGAASIFIQKFPEIELNSGTGVLPDAITGNFTSSTPALTTTETEIILSYTVSGDRKIKIQNDYSGNSAVGNVEVYEGTIWNPYSSPLTAWWTPNSTHQVRSISGIQSYNSKNWKFRQWMELSNQNNQIAVFVDQDKTNTAEFKEVQSVTVQTNIEGVSNGGNITYQGVSKTSPYSDYAFASPIATSVDVPATQTISGSSITFNFLNWSDGVGSTSRSIAPNAPTTYTANYKAQHTSSVNTGIVNGGQRKILRTGDGTLHTAYESAGKVWYEKKISGESWELVGSNDVAGGEAKSPSITSRGNNVIILYQKKNGSNYDIEYKMFTYLGVAQTPVVLASSLGVYTDDAQPVVASNATGKAFFAWKQTASAGTAGIYYSAGIVSSTGEYSQSVSGLMSNTDANSSTPSVAVGSTTDGSSWYHYPFVWTQGSAINYRDIQYRNNGTWQQYTGGGSSTISTGSGYTHNYNPSVVCYGATSVRTAWIGKRYEEEEEGGMGKAQIGPGEWVYRVVYNSQDAPSTFDIFGENVNSVNINKNNNGSSDVNHVVAWSSNNSTEAHCRNSAGQMGEFKSSGFLINGKDVQLSNGSSYTDMKGFLLDGSTSAPYRLKLSDNDISQVSKQQFAAVNNGREGVVRDSSAEFYFAIGDAMVDDVSIEFDGNPDTIKTYSQSLLNATLESKPFTISNNSNFVYSVQYGTTDSAFASTVLVDGKTVNFKVQLVDDQTNGVIGEFDNITFSAFNINQYNNIGYEVNTDGIGNKTVRLRLVVNAYPEVRYTLSNRYSKESVINLGKNESQRTKTGFKGSLEIKDYALSQNFPNPFNPTTTINYALPKDGTVVLKVYDILGKEIATLVNDHKESGRHSVEFDASNFSSGMYIYKLTSDKFSEVKKMMLVK